MTLCEDSETGDGWGRQTMHESRKIMGVKDEPRRLDGFGGYKIPSFRYRY